ncbi:hypothetical protein ABZ419_27860 [Streptomyces cinnamoneus]
MVITPLPDGLPKDPTGPNAAAKSLLNQATWWSRALKGAKAKTPYGS